MPKDWRRKMAFSFEKSYNRGGKFSIDTNGFGYMSLADLFAQNGADRVYPLAAIYINTKSQFGNAPVFATNEYFVNVPKHMLDTAQAILSDSDAIDAINSHMVGFKIHQYIQKRFNRVCYGVNFVDIDWNN